MSATGLCLKDVESHDNPLRFDGWIQMGFCWGPEIRTLRAGAGGGEQERPRR